MKKKEIEILWKLAKQFWLIGLIIWIMETLFFLIYEGWHIKPTNPIEIWFDDLVGYIWNFALCVTFYIFYFVLIKINKDSKPKTEQ